MKHKKVAFILSLLVTLLLLLTTGFTTNVIPFVLITILTWFDSFGKKDLSIWIIVISLFMFLINILVMSIADIIFWLVIAITGFIKK